MKKIITPVGTSLFTNYLKNKPNDIKDDWERIKEKGAKEYNNYEDRIRNIKAKIIPYLGKYITNASAEMESILKIKSRVVEEFEIHFLSSDTLPSLVAAEIYLQNVFSDHIKCYFNKDQDIIKGLQVKDGNLFTKEGMKNLINRMYEITGGYFENVIINITGGFKATIPFLTIFGQINNIPLYYIFEETDALIKIPQIPININWDIFDEYWHEFSMIEKDPVHKNKLSYSFLTSCESIIEIDNSIVFINTLGIILWNKYKNKYFIFYSTDNQYREIEKQKNIFRILSEKFHNNEIKSSKTETKGDHKVYDDGNNPFRIFYFERYNNIYIYKTFENEEAAQEYINKKINKEEIVLNSKPQRIEIQKEI